MSGSVYFVRHGETDWNQQHRLQGRQDIPLNQEGIRQAETLHDELVKAGWHFDRVYTSPLKRAVQTACIVSGMPEKKLKVDEHLIEISFGTEEGAFYVLRDPDLARKLHVSENIQNFGLHPSLYEAPEGGESFEQLLERARLFLTSFQPEKNGLVVSHGAFLHAVLFVLLGKKHLEDFWDPVIPNCRLFTVENGQVVWPDRQDGKKN